MKITQGPILQTELPHLIYSNSRSSYTQMTPENCATTSSVALGKWTRSGLAPETKVLLK